MGEATRDYGKSRCVLLTVQNATPFIQVTARVPSIPRKQHTVPRYPSSPSASFVFSGSRSRPSAHMDASSKSFLIRRSGKSATQIRHGPHQVPCHTHQCLGGLRCRQVVREIPNSLLHVCTEGGERATRGAAGRATPGSQRRDGGCVPNVPQRPLAQVLERHYFRSKGRETHAVVWLPVRLFSPKAKDLSEPITHWARRP